MEIKKPQAINRSGKSLAGTTLVEAILAMVILAVFVISVAAFNYYAAMFVNTYGRKAQALQLANNRLEELRSSTPAIPLDYSLHYVIKDKTDITDWVVSSTPPSPVETISINGVNMPIVTTVQYFDATPGNGISTYDYFLTDVQVTYKVNPQQTIEIQTYIGKQ